MDVVAYTRENGVNGLFDPLPTSYTIWAAFVAKQTWDGMMVELKRTLKESG